MKNPSLKEVVTLREVIEDAKKMNPSLKLIEQLKFYVDVQDKIVKFSSNFNTTDIAFSKAQLAKLITNVFEPDYKWQANQFVEQN